jgi:hypothetical protein
LFCRQDAQIEERRGLFYLCSRIFDFRGNGIAPFSKVFQRQAVRLNARINHSPDSPQNKTIFNFHRFFGNNRNINVAILSGRALCPRTE